MSARAVAASLALTAVLALGRPAHADDGLGPADERDAEAASGPAEPAPRKSPPREEILVEAPGGDPAAPKSGFCWACVLVGGGTLMVIGAIPLAVRATQLVERADGVGLGRAALGCASASTAACGALESADTNATPWAVSAGVLGGLGLAAIVSGALLGYAVPARDGGGISWEVAPADGGGATVSVRGAF